MGNTPSAGRRWLSTVKIDFLISPGIARAADQDGAGGEVEHDRHVRARAVGRRVGLEAGQLQYREIRDEAIELAPPDGSRNMLRANSACHAVSVIDPHAALVLRVGADVQVLDEQLALRRVRPRLGPQAARVPRLDRPVDLAPVDAVAHAGLVDDEAVVRAAPGMRAGGGEQRAIRDPHAFATRERQLHQRGRRQVPTGSGAAWRSRGIRDLDNRSRGHAAARRRASTLSLRDEVAPIKAQRRSIADVPATATQNGMPCGASAAAARRSRARYLT